MGQQARTTKTISLNEADATLTSGYVRGGKHNHMTCWLRGQDQNRWQRQPRKRQTRTNQATAPLALRFYEEERVDYLTNGSGRVRESSKCCVIGTNEFGALVSRLLNQSICSLFLSLFAAPQCSCQTQPLRLVI